jgi:hypothetical protein
MLEAIIGGALSGGFSLLSGLGAQKSAAKQQRLQIIENNRVDAINQERLRVANEARAALGVAVDQRSRELGAEWLSRPLVDADRFAADADRLGFNRQTYLNSGALSMYQDRSISGDAYKMMGSMYATGAGMQAPEWQGTQPTQMQRIPDALEILGNAGGAALNTGLNMYKQQQSQEFQLSMLNRQIQGLSQAKKLGGFGGTPSVTTSGQMVSRGGKTGRAGELSVPKDGSSSPIKAEEAPWINAFPKSWGLKVDPTWPAAEAMEMQYTEIGSWPYAVAKIANDAVYNKTGVNIEGNAKILGWAADYARGIVSSRLNPNNLSPADHFLDDADKTYKWLSDRVRGLNTIGRYRVW